MFALILISHEKSFNIRFDESDNEYMHHIKGQQFDWSMPTSTVVLLLFINKYCSIKIGFCPSP